MQAVGLIPRNRMKWIPRHLRFRHELCYFLHDECARLLVEAREADVDHVHIKFRSKVTAAQFNRIADEQDPITALRATGHPKEARRVIINRITMAMVSDSLHHIFEALRGMEKRKVIVALNVLRKPLKDSLVHLAWMLGDEDEFYAKFTAGDPTPLSPKSTGNHRKIIFAKAITKTRVDDLIDAQQLIEILFDRKNPEGLERYFQHAVHLVTIENIELKTSPENFNFIFKSPTDDDVYETVYRWLPYVLLFFSQVVLNLFNRMTKIDKGAASAFLVRTKGAFLLTADEVGADFLVPLLKGAIEGQCDDCGTTLKITPFNAAMILMREQCRCTKCQRLSAVPISWMF